jgi:hypothetical protein
MQLILAHRFALMVEVVAGLAPQQFLYFADPACI